MEKYYLVSVIIPAYKTACYIDKCLSSVIEQDYKNLEIVVVDDGSPDGLHRIVERYSEADSRVRLIRQNNTGAAGARNRGLKEAKGDFIFFLDSDDWLQPNAISLLLNKAAKENADVVIPDRFYKVDGNGKQVEELMFLNSEKYRQPADFLVEVVIGQGRAWRVASVLYRASIIKTYDIRFPEGHTAEDVIFNLEFLSKARNIAFIDYPILIVNKRHDSVTASYQKNLFETFLLIDQKAMTILKELNCPNSISETAIDSLLCRNIILLIQNEMSHGNTKQLADKISYINFALNNSRVRDAFNRKEFLIPYWNSKLKVFYIVFMRYLVKFRLNKIAITIAWLSNVILKVLR